MSSICVLAVGFAEDVVVLPLPAGAIAALPVDFEAGAVPVLPLPFIVVALDVVALPVDFEVEADPVLLLAFVVLPLDVDCA